MPTSTLARGVLIACLVLVAALLGVVGWRLLERADGGAGSVAGAAIGGPFSLVDQDGVRRTEADFRGQVMLVFFGFTHCPDICPTGLQAISDALDALGEDAGRVTPLFITVDPARDTVVRMKEYAANFHPRLVALTGSDAEIAAAAKSYRIFYGRAAGGAADSDYLMDHSALTYVMGPDGAYLTHFTPEDTAETIAAKLRSFL